MCEFMFHIRIPNDKGDYFNKRMAVGFRTTSQTHTHTYSSAPVFTGNTSQGLPRLRETADNTERYI
jgi:hypothetical protein